MNQLCFAELPHYQQWLAFVLVLLIERWLGRTKLTKAGSILELFENLFKKKDDKNV
jgi:hypothetical protein